MPGSRSRREALKLGATAAVIAPFALESGPANAEPVHPAELSNRPSRTFDVTDFGGRPGDRVRRRDRRATKEHL